ncbi:Uncharacterised protein [Kluyvera cryocrescens]|uniref:Uncharacterized protein n=1 Tax=Kluyvera cryocrescens TaxID=580 RepID=A0A485BTN8_KLUCR|nr:Uncharacterised protein [Kluyvera cryocrescens]
MIIFLSEDNFFNWDFNAHIATSNHDAVRRFEDFVEVVQAFLVFDLGDDLDVFAAVGFQVLTDLNHVRTFTDKGRSNEVNALLATEDQILFVFLSQSWQRNRNAWQVNAFVFAQVTVVQHFTDNFVTFDSGNFHADQTIVNQNGVAYGQVSGEAFIGDSNDFVVAYDRFVGRESEGLASFQGNVVTAFQLDGTDFWTFGIQQDSCFLTGFGSSRYAGF